MMQNDAIVIKLNLFCPQVTAIDKDEDDNGRVTYDLVTSSQYFNIDRNSGEIRTKRILDPSAVLVHRLTVVARDNGRPQKSSQGKTPQYRQLTPQYLELLPQCVESVRIIGTLLFLSL